MMIRTLALALVLMASLTPWTAAHAGSAVIDAHASYPEGPVTDRGRLLYVEYATSNIKSWDGERLRVYWHKDHCGASALIHYQGDHLLVACYDGNYLAELDSGGREVRSFSKDSSGRPFVGPNDFCSDGGGGIYFSASGVYDVSAPITGTVLHLSADGRTIRELAGTIHYSNGLTVAKDGRHLLVAEMLAARVLSFPIEPDGSLGPRVVWARLQDLAPPTAHEDAYDGPDGLKLGPDGNYYIAQNGSGRVLVVSDDKKLIRTIELPTRYVTNMAFGPKGSGAVYITGAFEQWKPPYPGVVYRWTP